MRRKLPSVRILVAAIVTLLVYIILFELAGV
jgi:hypothetical protein